MKNKNKKDTKRYPFLLERVMGIEPTYSAWKADVLPLNHTCIYNCQTVRLVLVSLSINKTSAQNRNRTSDTRIFSPLLYQLSYLGEYPRASVSHNARKIISLISDYFKCFFYIFTIFYHNSASHTYIHNIWYICG